MNTKKPPLDARAAATLRARVSDAGLERTAESLGLNPQTVLRAAAGLGVSRATARIIEIHLSR